MVEGLIGKKLGMTQIFNENGDSVPVTLIQAGPCTVIQKKNDGQDGYQALQLGFVEEKPLKHPIRPAEGHFRKSGIPPVRVLKEFAYAGAEEVKEGDQFFVDMFKEGEKVKVTGTSKGKGFAGVIKRWGFRGGKSSHGSMFHRRAGSIGASAYPSRVVKGKKMPGQMGDARTTVKNMTVVRVDKEKNLLAVKGAVPGGKGGYLLIKRTPFEPAAAGEAKKE